MADGIITILDEVDKVELEDKISEHTQSASTITEGYLGGKVMANQDACKDVNASQVRNIYAGTTKFTHGVTEMLDGHVYLQYK